MADIEDQQWYFSQVKGTVDEEIAEADVISCMEFNKDGELLATGDKGGRVVVFRRDHESKTNSTEEEEDEKNEKNEKKQKKLVEFSVYTTFQSHEAEFDYLKSLEIEEKINKIQWLKHSNPSNFLLSTNDKTIKLWKISEKIREAEGDLNTINGQNLDCLENIKMPIIKSSDSVRVDSSSRRVYANAHAYHINSISVNSDQETFVSADDLRINLWNLDITNQSFNIVDIKPANMEELTEVITAASFHPTQCNLLIYSSSKGTLRLCDLRSQALCDQHVKLYEEPEDPANRSFFSEIISSISDVKFSRDGTYMVTRDYLTVKIWDVRMESTRPVESYQVHDYLRAKLCALYENDCIFDKFEACFSHDNKSLLTGSYNNFFCIFDRNDPEKEAQTFEASRSIFLTPEDDGGGGDTGELEGSPKPSSSTPQYLALKPKRVSMQSTPNSSRQNEISVESLDFGKKILHAAWHPTEHVIAIAATNNLFIYNSKPS